MALVEGQFTGTGQSTAIAVFGFCDILIEGGDATVQIERSFNDGSNWYVTSKNSDGDAAAYSTTGGVVGFNGNIQENLPNVLYRLNCTVFTSGTINYRLQTKS